MMTACTAGKERLMYITRIKIDGFRGLSGLDWRPATGVNLVLGPNEAGKSTLADFVGAMIFGLSSGAESERNAPWAGGAFGGRLELDCGKFLVVIERDFSTGRFHYQELNSDTGKAGEPLSAELRRGSSGPVYKRYRELFSRHLGFFDENLFRRSVYVPQDEIELAGRDVSEAASALRALASGGGSAFDRALDLLKERYHNLTSDGDSRRKPGLVDHLKEERAELAAVLRESAVQSERAARLRGQVEGLNERLAKLRAEAAEAARMGELARERSELARRRASLAVADDAQRRRLTAAEDALRAAADLDQRLAAYEDLAGASGDFPKVVSRARNARDKVEQTEPELEAARKEFAAERVPAWPLVVTCALLALGLGGIGFGAFLRNAALWVPGAALAAGGLGMLGWTLMLRSRSAAHRDRMSQDIAEMEAELTRLRSDMESASAELMRQAGGRVDFSPGAMDGLLRRYGERLELSARRSALSGHLLEAGAMAELREACAAGVRELAVIDQRTETLSAGLGGMSSAEERTLLALPAKAAHLEEQADRLSAEVRALELDLAATAASDVAADSVEERIAELDALVGRHEAHSRALSLAREELAASIQEFQESHLDRLGALASGYLSAFTAERYPQVRLAGESLTPAVSGGGREEIDAGALSQGTRAALYLAVRLALGELLAGGRALPVILDDPLVDLDDARRSAALALFRQIGEKSQVLLMSCDRRLADAGLPVLELGGG